MLFRLSQNAFMRRYGELGYVLNQLTGQDLLYGRVGAAMLGALRRHPRSERQVVDDLVRRFPGVPRAKPREDLRLGLTAVGHVWAGFRNDL